MIESVLAKILSVFGYCTIYFTYRKIRLVTKSILTFESYNFCFLNIRLDTFCSRCVRENINFPVYAQ